MPSINFEPVDHCVLARLWWSYGDPGPEAIMTLNFKTIPLDPDEADCGTIATFLNTWAHGTLLPLVGNDMHYRFAEAMSRHSALGAYAQVATPGNGAGGSNGLGQQAYSPLVILKTGQRGRSYFGKSYTVTPPGTAITEFGYTGAYMASLVAAYETLKTTAHDATYPLCVASAEVNAVTEVQYFNPSPRLTMQTRRRQNFGR